MLDEVYIEECFLINLIPKSPSVTRIFPRNLNTGGLMCERNECIITQKGEIMVASVTDRMGDRSLIKYSAKTHSITTIKQFED